MVKLYIKLYQFLGISCFTNYCYIVVQAGLGFNINTNITLYSIVATKAAAEVITEIAIKITARLGYYL